MENSETFFSTIICTHTSSTGDNSNTTILVSLAILVILVLAFIEHCAFLCRCRFVVEIATYLLFVVFCREKAKARDSYDIGVE